MYLLDANILIYACNELAPEHKVVRRWLDGALDGAVPVATTDIVELALLRLTTLPRAPGIPPVSKPLAFLEALHARPGARRIGPSDHHRAQFTRLCRQHAIRGNDVYDAFLAALALEHGATLVTHDRGFVRFEGLLLFDPLAMPGLHEAGEAYRTRRRRRA